MVGCGLWGLSRCVPLTPKYPMVKTVNTNCTDCLAGQTPQFKTTPLQNLTLTVLVARIGAQWEGMGDVGSARYDHKIFKLQ